jgi:1-acyl-sn-glycerol-3-phosphate acyltransferase
MPSPDMPPIIDHIGYVHHVFAKWFSFFYFGLSTMLLIIIIFPIMRLCCHPLERFRRTARAFISVSLRFFVFLMRAVGAAKLEVDNREAYQRMESKIVVANHPSLLDIVMLLSLIPNADCIVRANLSRTLVRGVVKQLYIPNSLDWDDLASLCVESLRQGNCIIIFPEGTRTPRVGQNTWKRGAARLSLISGCGIVPVRIGGNDKYGLGKRDPWPAYNHEEEYLYRITMGKEISPKKYSGITPSIAVRRLNDDIKDAIMDEAPTAKLSSIPKHSAKIRLTT